MRSDPRGGTGGEVLGGVHRPSEDKFGLRRHSDDSIPEKVETNWEDLSKDDDLLSEEEERSLAEHAAQMRERGEDSRVIDHAMRMARDVLRRQRGHADDRLPRRVSVDDHHTDDRMPLRGGRFARARFSHDNFGTVDPANPDGRFLVDHGLDAMDSSRREIVAIHQLLKRFGPGEAGCCPDRNRFATDSKPLTKAETADLYERIPELARLDETWPGNSTRPNRYEV